MSDNQGDKFLTSVYDCLLDKVLGSVVVSFTTGSSGQAWDSLLTLRDVLPNEVKTEVQGLINSIETYVTVQLRQRTYSQSDGLFRRMYLENYISQKKHEVLDTIIRLLKENGYLQKSWTPVDRKSFETLELEAKEQRE